MNRLAAAFLLAAFVAGCGVKHIDTYQPKRRDYSPLAAGPAAPVTVRAQGSLWSERSEGGTLFTDVRAFAANDIVTIRIQEVASARREAGTTLDRTGKVNVVGDVAGLLAGKKSGTLDPTKFVSGSGENSFAALGETSRSDEVKFTVAATVTKVLPNGNLFIEGHRVVLVNQEEHHFYISGVARPEDIDRDNSIVSYQLADAQVEFTGRGVVSESQSPGWFSRLLNYITPF